MLSGVFRRVFGAAALIASAAFVAPAAVDARTLDEILASGEFRVGVNPTLPPRALFNDKNEIDGFEPEIAGLIAEMMGVKLVLVQVGSPDRIPFVAAGKVDAVMGAMSRKVDRAKVIDFTVPLHSENYGIVAKPDSPITSLEDLNNENITLIQVRGTTAIPFIEQKLPKAKLILLDNYADRDRALTQGRGDASFDGIDSMPFRLAAFANTKWKIIPVPEWGITYSSLGVAKGNDTLKDWLNLAIYELHTSGAIEAAWEKWFLSPMASKVPVSPYF
ncbi:MAG: transporter substrate-binding domain-containing protein [Gemmobacter sp.]|nr:transporter substrate-binding domain-containing protein [Gemmobacter sp.]